MMMIVIIITIIIIMIKQFMIFYRLKLNYL